MPCYSQLDRLPSQFDLREQNARVLDEGLATVRGFTPQARDERVTGHAHHLYVSRYDHTAFGGRPRAWFLSALRAEGIPCSPGYETPLHRMPAVLSERRKWAMLANECGRQVTCPDSPDEENLPVTDRASREEECGSVSLFSCPTIARWARLSKRSQRSKPGHQAIRNQEAHPRHSHPTCPDNNRIPTHTR